MIRFFFDHKNCLFDRKIFFIPAYDYVVQYVFCNDEYIIVYTRQKYSVPASTTIPVKAYRNKHL